MHFVEQFRLVGDVHADMLHVGGIEGIIGEGQFERAGDPVLTWPSSAVRRASEPAVMTYSSLRSTPVTRQP